MGKKGNLRIHAARTTALGCLIAVLVYILFSTVSSALVSRHYSKSELKEDKRIEYTTSLQTYVNEHQTVSGDGPALQEWCDQYPYLYITVYSGALPVLEEGFHYMSIKGRHNINPVQKMYSLIAFADGEFSVGIEDYTYIRYIQLWKLISAFLAFWPLMIVALYWFRLLSSHISSLSAAAQRIHNGDLVSEVTVPSHASEEILSLAENIDEMRSSFQDRLNAEAERSRANQELLAAMSHDIRTPLTTLIGYAEIMDNTPDLSKEERKQYSSIIYQRALRLKELTDEMFYYFLVYGSSDIKVDLSYYDASVLIPQLINDRLSAFQDLTVDFEIIGMDEPCTVHTDISLLNRVLENIFSNIRKYGDLTHPISILAERRKDDFIHIAIRNRIREERSDVESTHIGIKTCRKLMEYLDGTFLQSTDTEYYNAEVILPISQKDSPV